MCDNKIHDKQNLLQQIFRKQKAMSLVDRYTVLYITDGVYPRYIAVSCTQSYFQAYLHASKAVFLQDRVNRPTLVLTCWYRPCAFLVGLLTRKREQLRCSIYSPYTVQYMSCNCLPAGLMINEKNQRKIPIWEKMREPIKQH